MCCIVHTHTRARRHAQASSVSKADITKSLFLSLSRVLNNPAPCLPRLFSSFGKFSLICALLPMCVHSHPSLYSLGTTTTTQPPYCGFPPPSFNLLLLLPLFSPSSPHTHVRIYSPSSSSIRARTFLASSSGSGFPFGGGESSLSLSVSSQLLQRRCACMRGERGICVCVCKDMHNSARSRMCRRPAIYCTIMGLSPEIGGGGHKEGFCPQSAGFRHILALCLL